MPKTDIDCFSNHMLLIDSLISPQSEICRLQSFQHVWVSSPTTLTMEAASMDCCSTKSDFSCGARLGVAHSKKHQKLQVNEGERM